MRRALSFYLPLLLILAQARVGLAQIATAPALMNFQGRLTKPDGTPVADGNYSLRFSLWSAMTGGTERWNQTVNPVVVRKGTFAVLLSGFPAGTFNNNLWLEMKIGTAAALTPRQQLVSVAYAFKANSVTDNAITASAIASGAVTTPKIADGNVTTAKLASQSVTANILADGAVNGEKFASGTLNSLVWQLHGNTGVLSGFLGTLDNNPLELRTNNQKAVRYSYTEDLSNPNPFFQYNSINILGGSGANVIAPGVVGATIAGGGAASPSGVDAPNTVSAYFGTVGGGNNNTVQGAVATIGGGVGHVADMAFTTVAGGYRNRAGDQNVFTGSSATVGGGYENTAIGDYATIPGGFRNAATGKFGFAAGYQAKSLHTGTFVWSDFSTNAEFTSTGANQFLVRAAGGVGINTASPLAAFDVMGANNTYGTALLNSPKGPNASHIHYGTTGDWYIRSAVSGGTVTLQDTSGNVGIGTSTPNRKLTVQSDEGTYVNVRASGGAHEVLIGADIGGAVVSAMTNDHLIFRSGGNIDRMIILRNGNVGIGTLSPSYHLHVNGSVAGVGNYNNVSDARYKQHIATFPDALEAVLNLRGVTFDWKQADFPDINFTSGKQVGFIAQEVEKVLPELVTTDSKGYKSVAYANVVPVLVEAIKTIKRNTDAKLKEKDTEITELKAQMAVILERLEKLATEKR